MKKHSGFTLIETLLVVIVLAVIGFGGYLVWRQQHSAKVSGASKASSSRITTSTSRSPVLDKTYSNSQYGFSFKYPSSWRLTTALQDGGRGAEEGDVYVTSPNGTKVHFSPSQGGKGGDCIDDQANGQRTTRTCDTWTIYSVTRLPASVEPVYFIEASDTAATRDGGKKTYLVYLASNGYDDSGGQTVVPVFCSALSFFLGTYYDVGTYYKHSGLNVTVYIEGKDDSKNTSASFFSSAEVKEATPILKSFILN